jgi:hypothetical protein
VQTGDGGVKRLHDAQKLAFQIGELVTAVDFPGDDRSALACYYIALDQHEAVVHLIETGAHVSALALVRPQVEAFVRGAWIQHVATDGQIEGVRGDKFPSQYKMITNLEKLDIFAGEMLSKSKAANWDQLQGLTHPGAGLIAMVLKDGRVERNCDKKYLVSALNYTSVHALLAAAGVAMLANKPDAVLQLSELMKQWSEG